MCAKRSMNVVVAVVGWKNVNRINLKWLRKKTVGCDAIRFGSEPSTILGHSVIADLKFRLKRVNLMRMRYS